MYPLRIKRISDLFLSNFAQFHRLSSHVQLLITLLWLIARRSNERMANAITPKRSRIARYRSREDEPERCETRGDREEETHGAVFKRYSQIRFCSHDYARTTPEPGCKFKHVGLYRSHEIYLFDRA